MYLYRIKMITLNQFAYIFIPRDHSKAKKARLEHLLHPAAPRQAKLPAIISLWCFVYNRTCGSKSELNITDCTK